MSGEWFMEQLGWKKASSDAAPRCVKHFGRPYGPNLADLSNTASTLIAGRAYQALKIEKLVDVDIAQLEGDEDEPNENLEASKRRDARGTLLERGLENDLRESLADPRWHVTRSAHAHSYFQYRHLEAMQNAMLEAPELRIYAPGDYAVKSDVMVGVENPARPGGDLLLHAAVSSKLTLRSDRAQNVRTEFNVLVRNRRGRLPHLVVVTAEPLPSRLISLARGTGEIDANYHLLFDAIGQALEELLNEPGHHWATERSLDKQKKLWDEMVDGGRMQPYGDLAQVLAAT